MGEGITAAAARCDVTKRAEVERLVAWTAEQYGGVDIMVANAGALPRPSGKP
jgi:3-oxoacyl-[acyl-carrier protein] reductase